MAINSGLATHPVGFALAWESAGVSLWRPLPPPGYVALGCVASLAAAGGGRASAPGEASGPVPPPLKSCVVVARQVAVEALLAECMLLCTAGNLWCIQNSAGTFEVAPPDAHKPQVRAEGWALVQQRAGLISSVAFLLSVRRQPALLFWRMLCRTCRLVFLVGAEPRLQPLAPATIQIAPSPCCRRCHHLAAARCPCMTCARRWA